MTKPVDAWCMVRIKGQHGMAMRPTRPGHDDRGSLAMPTCGHVCNYHGVHAFGCCQCCAQVGGLSSVTGCSRDICPTCTVRMKGAQ